MPTTAAALRQSAVRAERDALDARDLAATLERQVAFMEDRLTPVLQRHRAEVWRSRAATASRLRLQITLTGQLGQARDGVATVVEELHRRAATLDLIAVEYRQHANRLDAAEALAAANASAASPESSPPSSSVPTWPVGVR